MGRKFDRAYGVLQEDKRLMDEACKTLMVRDFENKIKEYFELTEPIFVELVKENGLYRVRMEFFAERIKQFQVLK